MRNKLIYFAILFFALTSYVNAQTFSGATGSITDNYDPNWDAFTNSVSGLATSTSSSFGVEYVTVDITHTYDGDLSFRLVSPNGTEVYLSINNGGSGADYNNTVFRMDASSSITAGSAPFTGSYIPEGDLGGFQDGQNPNGTWTLYVQDDAGSDVGTLDSWSITFSSNPAPPCMSDCSDATVIASLPYSLTGQTTCDDCVAFTSSDACGSVFMIGPDEVYTYTPSSDGWVDVQLTVDETWESPTYGENANGAAVFLLDDCPSVGTANCVASSTVQYPSSHGSPHIVADLTAGVTYYIVVSNAPEPSVNNGDACIDYDIAVTNITQPNPNEQDCFGAQPICGSTITETSPGNGPGTYPSEINSSTSCLEGERNGKWYSFNVEASGTITVDIVPSTSTDDYDFALYNTTNAGCSGIFDGFSPQVACNYAAVDGDGDTGINSGNSENDYENTITVNVGESYMLYVSQWTTGGGGYTITLGGSADYVDDDGPQQLSLTQPNCAQNEVAVQFTEGIDCSSYASDGSNFTLSQPTGSSLTIVGASSSICDAGGSFTDEILLTLSGNITVGGTYTITLLGGTITDQCGHTNPVGGATVSFTIVTPTVTAGVSDNDICAGQTLSLQESGGVADAWSWSGPNSFSSTTQNNNISNAQANATGTYTVTGTITATSCASSSNVAATVHALPTVTANSTANPVCDGTSITLTGGGANSYTWDNSVTNGTSFVPNLGTTLYSVTGTDANSCSNTANISILVNPLPAVNPVTNAPICEGSNLTLGETGGDATSWIWTGSGSWNPADVQNPNQASALVSSTGTYTVTVSDGTCSNSGTVSVTVNDAPEVNAGSDAAICADQTYTLSGSYGGGATSALWTTSGAGSFDDATSPTATYTPAGADIPAVGAAANTVTLSLATSGSVAPCTSETDNMVLTINSMEDASFSYSSGSYCNTAADPTPTVTGVSGGTFSASAGITINASTGLLDVSSGTVGQTYTITYTTPGTCSNSSSVTVAINSGADAQFSYSTPVCSSSSNPIPAHTTGSDGVYSSTAGLVFLNTSTGEIDLSASTAGNYTVTNYVDLGACGDDTQTANITIDEAAEVFAGNDITVCESDGSYALSGATEGGSTSSITWTGGSGSFSNIHNINTNYVFGAGETGAVTLTVTTDNPGTSCGVVSDQIVVTINDAAEVNAGADDAICENETYTLSGTSGGATGNITWSSSGDGGFDDNTSLTAVYTPGASDKSNGTVTLTIASDDPSGPCGIVTDDMVLTVNPLPTVTAGSNSPVCQGTTLNLTETGGNATAWVWTGGYNPADIQNPSQSNIQVSATANYTVVGTIAATGCSSSDVVSVTVNPTPTVTAGTNAPICEDAQLNLTETGGDADVWTWTSTTSYNPDDIQNPIHTNTLVSEAGTYTVVGEITATGCTAQDQVTVVVNALPTVTANADDNTVCEGTSVTLTGSGASSYTWNNGVIDGNPFVPSVGLLTYTVTGTDANMCSNTDQIDVTVSSMPTVDAGSDATICENQTYALNGSIGGGASSAHWTTSGDGSFDDANNLGATYTPGATDPGTTVTLTLTTDDPASDCGAAVATMDLTVSLMDDASFSYSSGTFCNTSADPSPTITGLAGGSFTSAPAGLVIDGTTGTIDVSVSAINSYVVTYTTNGSCQNTSTFNIDITSGADAEFAYVTPICNSSSNPLPTHTTGTNGLYSSTAGLVFVSTGTGEIDLTASTPGLYTITNLVNLGACGSDTKTFDITIDEAEVVFAGADAVICESDGSYALVNATYSGTTNSVTWSGGTGTFTNGNTINATYNFGVGETGVVTLTVTTGNPGTSCGLVTDEIDITIDQAPTVDAGSDASICAGESYTLSGVLGGSTSNITWSRSGNGTFDNENDLTATYTPDATDLTNGTVTLTITSNANGTCALASDDMVLTINPLPAITAVATTPLCVGEQFDLTETVGEADTWVWTGTGSFDPDDIVDPTLASVYLAAAGTYTVTGTITATGCSNSAQVDLIVNPVPTVNAGVVTNPICANESVELTETGTEADAWAWSAVNGYTSSDNNPTIANATADTSGMYYVEGTIGATGCSSIDSVEITVNALPIIAYTVLDNDVICLGESVTLTGTPNLDGTLDTATIYTWNNGVNNGIAFEPTNTVTYTVLGEDVNGCKDSLEVQIVVNPLPIIFAGNDQIVPYNGTTTINDATPAGLNYSWTPSDSLVDASVLNPTTVPLHIFNEFILEGTDPVTGCSNTDTMNITIVGGPLSIQLFANPNDTICRGDAHYVYVIPSGGTGLVENFTYTWDDGNSGVYPNNDTLFLDTVITTRTYSVTVTDEGVGVVSASIEIVVNELPVITSIDVTDVLCYGENTGNILVNATGDNPLSYSINGGTTYINDSSFVGLSQGNFDISVQSNYGCITDGGMVNVIEPLLALSVTDTLDVDASCGNNNGLIAVEVTGGTAPYTYLWSNADTTSIVDTIYAGAYDVTITDDNNCMVQGAYTIANAGGGHLVIESITDVLCYGDSTGVLTVKITEGYPTFDFFISLAGNNLDSLMLSDDSVYTVNLLPSNTYQLTAYEGAGCISTIDVTIGSNSEILLLTQTDSLNCWNDQSGSIDLTVTGGTPSYIYSWTGLNGFVSNVEDPMLLHAGAYELTVTDASNCQVTIDKVNVMQPNEPGVTIVVQNQEQCYGGSMGTISSIGNGGTIPYTYKWTDNISVWNTSEIDSLPANDYRLIITDANNCPITDSTVTMSEFAQVVLQDSIVYTGTKAAIYLPGMPLVYYEWTNAEGEEISTESYVENLISGTYNVVHTNFDGCEITGEYEIKIPFIIPTLITPNADGYNDTWKIGGIESFDNIFIEIYNRWGNVVYSYSGSGFDYGDISKQFDGTYNGAELPIGAYVYILDVNNGKEAYHGTLNIVRTK